MKRLGVSIAGVATAAVLVIGGGGVAYADSLFLTDELDVEVSSIHFGDVACGESDITTVSLAAKRNGNVNSGNVFANSSTVTFSMLSTTGDAGAVATQPAPSTATLPSTWVGGGNNQLSSSSDSDITVGGSDEGSFSASVTYKVAGTNTAGAPFSATDTVEVTWSVVDCDVVVPDETAPVVVLTCPTEPVLLGTSAVATWEATDEAGGSGLAGDASGSIPLDTSTYGEAIATAPAGTAVDNAGNVSAEVTCEYFVTENTPPVVEFDDVGEFSCPAAPLILGSAAEVHWTAYDPEPGSGLADDSPSSGSLSLDTAGVGSKTATVPAGTVWDNAGNESIAVECDYSVIYDFDGFYRPVDMDGVVNSVKAGSAVPIKFSLDGDQGLDILAAGSPTITFTACNAGASVDAVEETVTAGGSSLSYDLVADQYVYVWKTVKTWAGKCGTFTLKLDDGTAHSALFAFTK